MKKQQTEREQRIEQNKENRGKRGLNLFQVFFEETLLSAGFLSKKIAVPLLVLLCVWCLVSVVSLWQKRTLNCQTHGSKHGVVFWF